MGLGARAQTFGGGPRFLPVSGSLRTFTRRPEVELSSASSQGSPQTPAVPARALRLPTRGRPTPPRKGGDAEQPNPGSPSLLEEGSWLGGTCKGHVPNSRTQGQGEKAGRSQHCSRTRSARS